MATIAVSNRIGEVASRIPDDRCVQYLGQSPGAAPARLEVKLRRATTMREFVSTFFQIRHELDKRSATVHPC